MIAIASDHGGYDLKQKIIGHFDALKIDYQDFGCFSEQSCDYPDYAKTACEAVVSGAAEKAILVCGTGIGMSIAANKIKGVRAAVCADNYSTKYTRLHNDANVMCIGARVTGDGAALALVDTFLETAFLGGRHQTRIDKVAAFEKD